MRIRTTLSGDARVIASALITGKRDAISAPVSEAMYVSSLAHVLSISGYHMAVVAGVVFVFLRAALALAPGLAERRPIKKWAAAAAFLAAAFYLVLSGAEVATQRAFIMTAIVLAGVMLDRQALTLRTLAIAALAVMAVTPEAVVHPSFQMSFAATLALVAAYDRGIPWIAAGGKTSLGARFALWGARELAALVFASLVAGLATTVFAAYHFHRLAPYGVLANLLAMPVVSAFVMPTGLLALAALPFGFDAPVWRLMGHGVDWMTGIALWVASLPGAVGRIPAFGIAPLLVATAGLIVICLLRTPLRWSGAGLLLLAALLAAATPRPDVLVAADGETVAVRRPDGRLAVLKTRSQSFAPRDWLGADGDARQPGDAELASGFVCDPVGCIARLADGTVVAIAQTAEAFADDCSRAALVVARRDPPADCAATVIDRSRLGAKGALALRRIGQGWDITAARPPGYDRPWAPRRRRPTRPERMRLRPALRSPRRATLRPRPRTWRRGSRRDGESSAGSRARRLRNNLQRLSGAGDAPQNAPCESISLRRGAGSNQYRRMSPTSLPWMRTRLGGRMRTSCELLAGSSAIEAPRRRKRFSVASSLVDQRHDDVAGFGVLDAPDQRDVAVENAGLDHRIAAHFEREMLARAQQFGRHIDDSVLALDRLDRRAGRDPAHQRHGRPGERCLHRSPTARGRDCPRSRSA